MKVKHILLPIAVRQMMAHPEPPYLIPSNNKVIGIHKGKIKNANLGTYLYDPINDFINQNDNPKMPNENDSEINENEKLNKLNNEKKNLIL